MIKVVIVEDMPPILWSLKNKIEDYSPEVQVVGEALNGQDAILLANELEPDIVFTDVRMPVMDGLELISILRQTHPHTCFIIISGYNEFEYARQAMKLGVEDYILKPVTQQAINDVLFKAIQTIKANTAAQEKILLNDMLNRGTNKNIAGNKFNKYEHFVIALHCAGSFSMNAADYTNPFNFFWSEIDYSGIISRFIPPKVFFWCFEGKSFNEMILMLGIPNDCPLDHGQLIRQCSEELAVYDTPINIAVSDVIDNINNIGIEFQNIRLLLRKNLVFGKSNIIFSTQLKVNVNEKNNLNFDSSFEKRLASFVQNRQKVLFMNDLKKILVSFEKNNLTQYSIEEFLKYIVHICLNAVVENLDSLYSLDFGVEEIICISKDYSSLLNGLTSMYENFFSNLEGSANKHEPMTEIVGKVESYMISNYTKQITINNIADMVNVNPCHLSKTFKLIKGISPMDYLTHLRIDKSKELITNSNLMLKDIAEIVGYTNQYYFSRIFKTVTGQSPSEYKSSADN